MWKRCSEGQTWNGTSCIGIVTNTLNWRQALQIPVTLNATTNVYAGYKDWRVPNVTELDSILADRFSPSINEEAFPNTASNIYWTSSAINNGAGYSWVLSFDNGDSYPYLSYERSRVRLVRGGK